MTLKHQLGKVILPLLPVNRRAFNIIRFECNAWWTRILNRISPSYLMRRRQILNQTGLSINLGSGGRGLEGWINIDALRHHADQSLALDIRRPLPFKDNQAKRIFAEHVLEHLEFSEDVPKLLAECYRVLEPGGMLRIIVPDGRRWLEAYVTGDQKLWDKLGMSELPEDMPTQMAMINHVFHQSGEHQFAYDFETLEFVLKQAGFSTILHSSFNKSLDSELAIDREEHRAYSLYVEAQK